MDASHESVTEVAATADGFRLLGADGAVVSEPPPVGAHASVVADVVAAAEALPAASRAVTPIRYEVPHVRPVSVNEVAVVVPELVEPSCVRS